ncbi:MAG TPA: pyridoxamine 5'-phosphate oxidase family protein [Methanomicrobiales archaeon]|nr:pyridoxamine 5'-phosphate oxidase family protein [Methanomicrobiales archaeon]
MALKDKILQVIGGPHPAAVATIDQGRPAVRFMVLAGFPDLTLVGATGRSTRKVAQLRKNPDASLSIWSGKEFTDPYVVIRAKGRVHEDLATKKKYWTPMMEQYFKTVDNPEYVVLVFTADEIEYTDPRGMETWKR